MTFYTKEPATNSGSNDFLLKLMSSDLTVRELLKSNSHITSLFLPFANDILTFALTDKSKKEIDFNPKLLTVATKILDSNNSVIKLEILKTDKFKESIEHLISISTDSSTEEQFFITKFATITENYLTNYPKLIENEFSFFSAFSRFIFSNFTVFLMFKNLLNVGNSNSNSIFLYNYLNDNDFTNFLFQHFNDESIDLLIQCAQVDIFHSPNFNYNLINFDFKNERLNNRKWEIISKYASLALDDADETNYSSFNFLSDFAPLLENAFVHINPFNFDTYLPSQVAALQFITVMYYNDPSLCEDVISNVSSLLDKLKKIIIFFPNHSIAVNEAFSLAQILIISSSSRSKAIEIFIPFAYNLLMFQKSEMSHYNNENVESENSSPNESEITTSPQQNLFSFYNHSNDDSSNDSEENNFLSMLPSDDECSDPNELKKIKKILNPCLRGFSASFINRLMIKEDEDIELEKNLNESDFFRQSVDYLIEFYNPLSESGYGNIKDDDSPVRKKLFRPMLTRKNRLIDNSISCVELPSSISMATKSQIIV